MIAKLVSTLPKTDSQLLFSGVKQTLVILKMIGLYQKLVNRIQLELANRFTWNKKFINAYIMRAYRITVHCINSYIYMQCMNVNIRITKG